MNWHSLEDTTQLEFIRKESFENPVVIFKHSTSCGTSRMALDRLERNWKEEEMARVKTYYLDVRTHRPVSNAVAELFQTHHESPQLLLIQDGGSTYDRSHFDISYQDLRSRLGQKTG